MATRQSGSSLLFLGIGLASISSGCALLNPSASARPGSSAYVERTAHLALHGASLTLHLASAAPARAPLVLYASGDGGWFGAAVDMFHAIAQAGYPTVGLSSRSFLRLERPRDAPLTEARLAADYEAILDEAKTDLKLQTDTPVILTGWSRGAAFAVITAARLTRTTAIDGIVAIGLDEGEDLKVDADDSDDDDNGDGPATAAPQPRWPFEPYTLIRTLDPLRIAVIQATHDGYLPAARARGLFGPDTASRRLVPIDARNHRFSGGREPFRSALIEMLGWIAGRYEG